MINCRVLTTSVGEGNFVRFDIECFRCERLARGDMEEPENTANGAYNVIAVNEKFFGGSGD